MSDAMTATTRPVRSRRERPAKPALSRQWIIDATIELMRTEGLERATMRRVAQALDTGPASLYVYVANTTELHAAVLDELIGTLPTRRAGDWRERLLHTLHDYGDILFEHPGLARSALVLRPTGTNAIALFDRLLGLLLEGGVAPDRAAWGIDLLVQYVNATAAEHSAPAPDQPVDDSAQLAELAGAVRSANPKTAPHLVANADAVLGGTPDQRFTWAIDALVAGMTVTPTPVARRDPHGN